MRFVHRQFLWLLTLILPALIAFLIWSWRTRERLVAQFMTQRLLGSLIVGVSPLRRKIRLALLVLSVALLLVALARPQWGFEWEEAKQRGLDIVVALDTSKSMLAEDVKPNRLERAKLAALELGQLAKSDRLALLPFAGSAFLQCPLTSDSEIFAQNVRMLDTKTIPRDGTALPDAIETAMTVLKADESNVKTLVILTDGENHEGDPLAAAQTAARSGLRIFTIGIGTAEGELIPERDIKGRIEYHRDADGNVVKSHLAESLLQQVATEGNGFYMPLRGAKTMDTLYQEGLAPMPKSELSSRRVRRYHERYVWPLALAIVFLVIEMVLPERKSETGPANLRKRQSVGHS
jgi:Ca-activated chloride channel family protein